LPAGVHHYRLRLLARDGSVSYSKVELLMVYSSQTLITGLQQNPVAGGEAVVQLYSARAQQAEAMLYDMAGRLLASSKLLLQPGFNRAPVSMHMLPSGMYKLLIRTQDGVEKVIGVVR
jgi:hypothetical protein